MLERQGDHWQMSANTLRTRIAGWLRRDIERPLEHLAGGRARLKVIVLLACVLGLDAADKATVGAIAPQLKLALHINDVQIGFLVTASTAVAALVTLPFGVLADRVNRSRLLVVAIVVWSLAMIVNGASTSYIMLLLPRLLLGAIVASASPIVVSMTGDFFRPGERGRIFGYMLAGQLFGVACGFLLSGHVAAMLDWRAAFWALAVAGLVLALVIWKGLPEPARGGQSYVPEGADTVPASSEDDADSASEVPRRQSDVRREPPGHIETLITQRDIQPHASQVLKADPADLNLWQTVRHVLSVRTFRSLILASALGYFYFTGLRTFALMYMRNAFGLDQGTASTVSVGIGLGAVAGALLVGRIGDRLIRRGHLTGRIHAGGVCYLLAAAALVIGLLGASLYVVAPLFFVAAMGVGGANPAVDAARLDVIHSSLWGCAEGVRATFRYALEAIAPPLFGYAATRFGRLHDVAHESAKAAGMRTALLVMLATLVAAGLVLMLRASRTYARDVATTQASERATRKKDKSSPST